MNALEIKYLPIYKAAAAAANAASATPMPAWWPGCAAAEAWCETGGFGAFPEMPMLAGGTPSYNCLGIKGFAGYQGPTVAADGTEALSDGGMSGPQADNWRVYASFEACFADQIAVLHGEKNADGTLRYQAALDAATPEEYIAAECAKWSTDPQKAANVLATWRAHQDLLGAEAGEQ